ncbi:MAG: ABC transporter permease subunit [Phycisphaera sp.]|nr:ABC transporter permease subunit [Phycisphaera sp.]
MLKTDAEKEQVKQIKDEEDAIRAKTFPMLVEARIAQTKVAEEKQYLVKLAETLGQNNRNVKVAEATAELDKDKAAFYAATGDEAYMMATRILKAEERIEKSKESSYAKPWTLPGQIVRSIGCVFLGFVIATLIAIPVGVLCGLNSVFMAALTPFIALFKPVSPIVWLPIVFIIVGGFIDRPDEAIVAPAFLSSAITVALCSLWPTLVNTALGVASIDKDHLNVARVLKLGIWSRLTRIVIPSSLPLIFAGMRISLGVGWMVLIAAELLSSSEGLGKFVWDMFNNGSPQTFAQMFVVVFVVGIIGLLLDRIMIVFQRSVSFDGAPAAI